MKGQVVTRCLVLMVVCVTMAGWTATRADVVVTDGFEIGDGDIHDNTPPGGLNDWENCNCTAIDSCNADVSTANTPGGSAVVSDQTGKTDPSYFTIGSTKDFNDLSVWHHAKPSNPVDKDDIVNAYALEYMVPDTDGTADQLIYVGGDRFDNNGSAFIGAWFFQNAICQGSASDQFFSDTDGDGTCGNNGAPLATHKDGDLLILAEFDKGGTVGTVKLERWVGSGSGTPADLCAADGGTLNAKHPESICDLPPNSLFASGIQNSAAQVIGDTNGDGTADVSCSSDWSYKQKGSKVSGVIGVNDFFEVGANLSHFPGLGGECFSTFLLETRSSFEIDAILKDYVLHNFAVCHPLITVTKDCTAVVNSAGDGVDVTFSGQVCNTGNITLTNVTLTDDKGGVTNPPASTIAPGGCSPYSGSYSSTSCANTDTVTVTATGSPGGQTVSATATASCPATCTQGISVDKGCTATVNSTGDAVNVSFSGQVCNTGNQELTGVTLTDDKGGVTNPPSSTLAPGACSPYSGTYSTTGTCNPSDTVTVTATSALTSTSVSNSASATCGATCSPNISVTKDCQAAVNTAGTGVNVTFNGQVCNTGNLKLTGVSVSDDKGGVTAQPSSTLDPGACSPYSGSYSSTVCTNNDTVTATATSAITSASVSKQATATCSTNPVARISVTKSCTNKLVLNASTSRLEDRVDFSGTVCAKDSNGTNSDVQLTGVSLIDDKGGVATPPSSTLAPGACSSYSGTYFPTDPNTCTATDTVTASGSGICDTSASSPATASCILCQ